MNSWGLASVVLNFFIYLAVAASIGGISTLALLFSSSVKGHHTPGYRGTSILCVLGIALTGTYFLVRVGDFASAGFSGMTDVMYIQILWDSPVGEVLKWRAAGFIISLVALAVAPLLFAARSPWLRRGLVLVHIGAILILASTFSFVGHSTELGAAGGIAVTIHVAVALWWAGSLYPLWRAARSLEPQILQIALYRFGHIASGLLIGMILAGAVLLYLLVIVPDSGVSTAYATAIVTKLTAVSILFGIAAMHKWRSVPRLLQQGGVAAFQRSLALEITLILLILALTSVLSSVIGPSSY